MGRPFKTKDMYPDKVQGNCRSISVRIPEDDFDWIMYEFMPMNKKYATMSACICKFVKMCHKEWDKHIDAQNPTATGGL